MVKRDSFFRGKILPHLVVYSVVGAMFLVLYLLSRLIEGQTFFEDKSPPMSEYQLLVNGGRLYLEEGRDRKEFFVAGGSAGPFDIYTSGEARSDSEIINILDKRLSILAKHSSDSGRSRWCLSGETVYFLNQSTQVDHLESDNPKVTQHGDLWKWTKKRGFESVLKTSDLFQNLSLSSKGDQLCLQYWPENEHQSKILTYSLMDGERKQIEMNIGYGTLFMAGPQTFLILADHDPALVYDSRTKKPRPLGLNGFFVQAVSLHGDIWCLRYLKDKYDIVKLNPELNRIEKTVSIPNDFPQGIPPDDGMHG